MVKVEAGRRVDGGVAVECRCFREIVYRRDESAYSVHNTPGVVWECWASAMREWMRVVVERMARICWESPVGRLQPKPKRVLAAGWSGRGLRPFARTGG